MAARFDALVDAFTRDMLNHHIVLQEGKIAFGGTIDQMEVAESRVQCLGSDALANGANMFRSAVRQVTTLVVQATQRNEIPLYAVADWLTFHVEGVALGSRAKRVIPLLPVPFVDSLESRGEMVDEYSVPLDDLAEARSCAEVRALRQRMGPSLRRQFDQRCGMLNEPGCMMIVGTDRNGNAVCRHYDDAMAVAG